MSNPNTAKFPTNIATDQDIPIANDAFFTTLTANITDTQTSGITVANGSFNFPCLFYVEDEAILVLAVSGQTITNCIRGVQNTIAVAHNSGAQVTNEIFATCQNQLSVEVQAIENFIGAAGANVIKNGQIAGGNLSGIYPNPTVAAVGSSTSSQIANAVANSHTRNADVGTSNTSFQIDSGNNGPVLKDNAGTLEVKSFDDSSYSDLKVQNLTVTGAINGRKFVQTFTSQTTVTVTHNLNTLDVIALAYDSTNSVIGYSSLQCNTVNSLTVTFTGPQTGKIVVMG